MMRKVIFIVLCITLVIIYTYPLAALPQPSLRGKVEPIEKTDRILILAPHPDDEAIGCAGVIQAAVSKGADVRVVYLTNGDHNQVAFIVYEKRLTLRRSEFIHMGEVRRQEAIKAMKLLGLDEKKLIFLGYPDFGTFTIFRDFWQNSKPFESILTRISRVPYKENLSFGAPYIGESILADLKTVLKGYKPTKIFVSHPADANVDHKAFYLFLQVALHDLKKEISQPKIYPYLVHCIGWPLPRHYHPQLNLNPPGQILGSQVQWLRFNLSPEQLQKKYQALLCYKSQTETSAFYLLAFARQNELFGEYPELQLKKQASSTVKPVSFFGFSEMFNVSPKANWDDAGALSARKGKVSYSLLDDNLLIRLDREEEFSRKFSTQLYLFGYSEKSLFAQMPKIRIITKYKKFRVFDGKRMISAQGIDLEFKPKEMLLKVPLKILGEPDFILTAFKTYAGILHTDTTSFRKIKIIK
jgi:LmbE family N-acetylglucosaminyl deacetylase